MGCVHVRFKNGPEKTFDCVKEVETTSSGMIIHSAINNTASEYIPNGSIDQASISQSIPIKQGK